MSENSATTPANGISYNKTQLLVILLTPLIVMAVSSWLYFSGVLIPDGQTNKGVLLSPVLSVTDFGYPEPVITDERKWTMLQVSSDCKESCEEQVYVQRQIHIALGKLESRIERVLLTQDADITGLKQNYPRLTVNTTKESPLSKQLLDRVSAEDLAKNPVFIADPFGNVMLYFTNEHDYKAQISDIKKLLKLSTIG
ncbi:hypothetical protein [Reinekea sp.]|uniref:hypothetical protein n=1 Tax=Reinekea sp. TaxID=1970455 RepID=UPI00398948E8